MGLSGSRLSGLVLAAGLLCFVQSAQAATTPCTNGGYNGADISGDLTANIGCAVGSAQVDSVAKVNSDAVFGVTSWQLAPFAVSFISGTTGSWAITNNSFKQIMLVLVGPPGSATAPQAYVAYLLNAGETSGNWVTPFVNGNANTPHGPLPVTSITAYVTPLPGALPLFASVVGLVALMRWRKRSTATA